MADDCPKCPPAGAPLWLATFADLMSLLMCFFVLLLSFATMDANKLKKVSESLEAAFGVQREVPATEIPMGTSIIAQHFSPAMTTPTLLEEVRQTINSPSQETQKGLIEKIKKEILEKAVEDVKTQTEAIKKSLKGEISEGLVMVGVDELKIVIRINDKGSFKSGTAELQIGFKPVMRKITQAVLDSKGKVIVSGHTDDIPISTDWFRSNWELSSSRAVSVTQFMLDRKLNSERVVVQGHADTQPLVPNTSRKNRSQNRRVEILLEQTPEALYKEELTKFEGELDEYKKNKLLEVDNEVKNALESPVEQGAAVITEGESSTENKPEVVE
ncbi:MAG: MotB family protein [Methyloprofundus sp.]|nr:MotB family protein [Methyloprofundus sp.]